MVGNGVDRKVHKGVLKKLIAKLTDSSIMVPNKFRSGNTGGVDLANLGRIHIINTSGAFTARHYSYQWEHFRPMIPKLYHEVWQRGLDSGEYALKLCGAGGGGVFLGITAHFKRTAQLLSAYETRPLFCL